MRSHSTIPLDIEDDFVFVDTDQPLKSEHHEVNITDTNFNERGLSLSEVYYAACGIFVRNNYKCIGMVKCDSYTNELARVFRRTDNGRLYIMYYPGKDNNEKQTLKDTRLPLNTIMFEADKVIAKCYGQNVLNHAIKNFIIIENGIYVKGDLAEGILTLEILSTLNGDCNQQYVTESKHLPHIERIINKTVNITLDSGCHSLEAIERSIAGNNTSFDFFAMTQVRIKHFAHYRLGIQHVPPIIEFGLNKKIEEKIDLSYIEKELSEEDKNRSRTELNIDHFIEITPSERSLASHMETLNRTGRATQNQSEFSELSLDENRGRVIVFNLDENEKKNISSKHQQDIFTAPSDLISEGNPLIICKSDSTQTIIYKNANGEIIADCLVNQINLQLLPSKEDPHPPVSHIHGKILFRYKWIGENESGNWMIQFTGANTREIKKLLLGQHIELKRARDLNVEIYKNKANRTQLDHQLNVCRPLIQSFIDDLASPSIPVYGRLGANIDDGVVTLKRLEKYLRLAAKDRNLEIISTESNDAIVLNIYTNKSIRLFDHLGVKRINEQYELTIDTKSAKQNIVPIDHLFGIRILDNGQFKSLNVLNLLYIDEIQHYSKLAVSIAKVEARSEPDSHSEALTAMRTINQYFKDNSKITFHLNDYNNNRVSWKNILLNINYYIQNPHHDSLIQMKELIAQEARNNQGLMGTDYSKRLMNLYSAIRNKEDIVTLVTYTTLFYHLYRVMDKYREAIEIVNQHNSKSIFFKPNMEKHSDAKTRIESLLYDMLYQMLGDKDKNNFLDPDAEKIAECNFINHFRY